MAQSSAGRVEKFGSDRRKGRESLANQKDGRKKQKTQRGKERWSEQDQSF